MRHRANAEVVADKKFDARRLRPTQHAVRVFEPALHPACIETRLARAPLLVHHQIREVQARRHVRALLRQRFDTFVVHHVAMVDNVETGLQRLHDSLLRRDMPADFLAAFMRRLRRRRHLIVAYRHDLAWP